MTDDTASNVAALRMARERLRAALSADFDTPAATLARELRAVLRLLDLHKAPRAPRKDTING